MTRVTASHGPAKTRPAKSRPADGAYRALFRQRHVGYLIVSNLFGRLPTGMAALTISLFLRSEHASFPLVGVMLGIYAVATAVGGPVQSRIVDSRGQAEVLAIGSLLCCTGFVCLPLTHTTNPALLVPFVFLAGLCYPPLEPCLRSLWPRLLADERSVHVAYSLDASLQQILFVAGPLLVTGVALLVSPGFCLLITGGMVVAGTLLYVGAQPVRQWRADARSPDWAGPLRSPSICRVLAAFGCIGCALGIFNLAVVAYSEHVGVPSMPGILLGAHAGGALAGGLVFGSRRWPGTAHQQLRWVLGALVICYLPLITVAPPPLMTICMGIAGLFLAPALTCGFVIIGQDAPPGTLTEASAWLMAIVAAGVATGAAVAGSLERFGLWAIFGLPALAAMFAVAISTTHRVGAGRRHGPD
jgi:predicted MFS family arabinose efflux permease